jgi:hypothetical protein
MAPIAVMCCRVVCLLPLHLFPSLRAGGGGGWGWREDEREEEEEGGGVHSGADSKWIVVVASSGARCL